MGHKGQNHQQQCWLMSGCSHHLKLLQFSRVLTEAVVDSNIRVEEQDGAALQPQDQTH